jgi:hypothetical protein
MCTAGVAARRSGAARPVIGAARAASAGQGQRATPRFVCNQVTAMTLTREWFQAGFETTPGIADDRWQLKAREHGYITEWANPDSDFWNQPVASPCANGSAAPDHVVFTVLSWVPPCCATQAAWESQITAAVTTARAKYAGLKRVDLMTVIRGPGNQACPAPPAPGETVSMPAELDAALSAVAAHFPNLVFVAPRFEAPACSVFRGGGPHLTRAGNADMAKQIAAYFATVQ